MRGRGGRRGLVDWDGCEAEIITLESERVNWSSADYGLALGVLGATWALHLVSNLSKNFDFNPVI